MPIPTVSVIREPSWGSNLGWPFVSSTDCEITIWPYASTLLIIVVLPSAAAIVSLNAPSAATTSVVSMPRASEENSVFTLVAAFISTLE